MIGERGEPCGVPVGWVCNGPTLLLNRRQSVQSVRNASIHSTRSALKPQLRRMTLSLSLLILSKKPDMSKSKAPACQLILCARLT